MDKTANNLASLNRGKRNLRLVYQEGKLYAAFSTPRDLRVWRSGRRSLMKNSKEISIDQFSASEKELIAAKVKALTLKKGHVLSQKEEKEILKEAKRLVMKDRAAKESSKAAVVRKPRKPAAAKESEVKEFNWAASLRKNPRALKDS
ncbi:DUF3811 domain-containing protein [Kalamiella sp. sgz302252]|uniref:DUF3811 domain-containing protein n=1 Tax=Pantoea sp. sgz302252 TaxID=3341827 RepID=UPI0036D2F88D